MKKSSKKQIAEQSLQIIKEGFYVHQDKQVDVKHHLDVTVNGTFTVSPDEWSTFLGQQRTHAFETIISVTDASSIAAISEQTDEMKIGVLNFASAKNPGGGFLGGASAQEESLARSSGLYASLTKDMTLYNHNRNHSTFLYSDYMIYSPQVSFWYNDAGETFEQPLYADVITAPAPNLGAMIQHQRMEEMEHLEPVLKSRMDKVLCLAHQQQIECLILGAWGCGVFRNDSKTVARLFKEIIDEKYTGCFRKIVFAVYDSSINQSKLHAFEEIFVNNLI